MLSLGTRIIEIETLLLDTICIKHGLHLSINGLSYQPTVLLYIMDFYKFVLLV